MTVIPYERTERALRGLLILAAVALLAAAYRAGIARGLDSYIAIDTSGLFLHSVCAVATKWLTGVGDYVCLRDVQDIMSPNAGIMYDLGLREDGQSWAYLSDRAFVDHALQSLFAHPHWTVPTTTSGPPYIGIQGIGWGMDEGYYNFVDLAFHVFGPSMEALYATYWLVLGISVLAFAFAYRRATTPLVLLLVVALVQYMIFSTSFLWFANGARAVTEPASPRFLSSLCVLPALHFFTAAWSTRPLRWRGALPLAVQALVFSLAMLQRTTVLWVAVAAVVLAAMYCLLRLRSAAAPRRRYYEIAALAVATGLLTHTYLAVMSHPGIKANGFTSGHNVWFGLFYNLQANPDWKTKYAAQYANKDGDFLPDYAWRRYLAEHREEWPRWNPNGTDPFELGITQAGIEELCRKAFFEFAKQDPKFVLEIWLYYNPHALEIYTATFLRQCVGWMLSTLALVPLIGLGALCAVIAAKPASRQSVDYVPLIAFLGIFAALPNVASLVIDTSLTDYFVLLGIVVGMVFVAIGVAIGALGREAVRIMSAARPVER